MKCCTVVGVPTEVCVFYPLVLKVVKPGGGVVKENSQGALASIKSIAISSLCCGCLGKTFHAFVSLISPKP